MEVLFEDVFSRSPPIAFLPPLAYVDPGPALTSIRLVGSSKSSGSMCCGVGRARCYILGQHRSIDVWAEESQTMQSKVGGHECRSVDR